MRKTKVNVEMEEARKRQFFCKIGGSLLRIPPTMGQTPRPSPLTPLVRKYLSEQATNPAPHSP